MGDVFLQCSSDRTRIWEALRLRTEAGAHKRRARTSQGRYFRRWAAEVIAAGGRIGWWYVPPSLVRTFLR